MVFDNRADYCIGIDKLKSMFGVRQFQSMPTWPRSSKDVKGTLHAKEVWLKGNNQLRKTWQNSAIHQLEEPDFRLFPTKKVTLWPHIVIRFARQVSVPLWSIKTWLCHGMPWRQLVASHSTASSNRSFFYVFLAGWALPLWKIYDQSSLGMIRDDYEMFQTTNQLFCWKKDQSTAAAEAPYPHCQAQTCPRPVGNSCGDKFGDHTAPFQGSTLDKTKHENTLDGWIYTRWIMTSRFIDIPSFCSCGLYFCWKFWSGPRLRKPHASHTINWKNTT